MENKLDIQRKNKEDALELKISGRIDAYWSEQLNTCLDEEIRAGNHNITFDLDEVTYISSIGIRLFIKYLKQLNKINGHLSITTASQDVRTVFNLAGLDELFGEVPVIMPSSVTTEVKQYNTGNGSYLITTLQEETALNVELMGKPLKMKDSTFTSEDFSPVEFKADRYGIGIGALGNDVKDYSSRIGEFIGLSNVVAYLPTDGTHQPDFVIRTGNLVPALNILYGILIEGNFSYQVRFETKGDKLLYLSDLTKDLLKFTDARDIAIVMLAETSGLVGASLNHSPFGHSPGYSIFTFPDVRKELNFTTEPAYNRMLALTVGVATTGNDGPVMDFTRPMGKDTNIRGHFHAAVFPYTAQKKDTKHPNDAIAGLFELSQPLHILHLMNDEREVNGVGESEFIQGMCWIGKINTIK